MPDKKEPNKAVVIFLLEIGSYEGWVAGARAGKN
jgi:hypothetical protein